MTNKKKIKRVVKLPEDIIVEILLKLPFKYLIQCSCVSKKWRSLILFDPQFSKPYYKVASEQRSLGQSLLCVSRRSKFPLKWFEIPVYTSNPKFQSLEVLAGDHVPNSFLSSPFKEKKYGSLQLLGSCNGLVCLGELSASERHYKNVCIWNPSTGFIRKLPVWERKPQSLLDGVIAFASSGFGYVSATDDYKYVALANDIDCSTNTIKGTKADIFSLRTKSWKRIEVPPILCYYNEQSGILSNEALHWITLNGVDIEMETTITAFDLGKEEFRQMPLPVSINTSYGRNRMRVLVLLGECLCVWHSNRSDIQLWVMREYNVHESWNLLYYFRTDDLPVNVANVRLKPVFVTESGTLVLKVFDKNEFLIRIECHKKKKPVCSDQYRFEELDIGSWSCDAIQYDQTLLSADM